MERERCRDVGKADYRAHMLAYLFTPGKEVGQQSKAVHVIIVLFQMFLVSLSFWFRDSVLLCVEYLCWC